MVVTSKIKRLKTKLKIYFKSIHSTDNWSKPLTSFWKPSRPGYNFCQNGQVRYSWLTSVNPGESWEMFRRWLDYGILKNRIVLVHEIGCCRNHFWVWVNVKKRFNNMYKDKRRRIFNHPNKWYTWVAKRWFCNWPCPSCASVKHFVASDGFFKI